jgi:hypothetical protein
MLSLG